MAYGDFKDLPWKTASDKVLCNKAFNFAKNPKYDGSQRGLASTFITFLLKRLLVVVLKMKICQKNINSSFIDNIWGADLADMQLISNYNKGIHFYYVLWTFIVNMHEICMGCSFKR